MFPYLTKSKQTQTFIALEELLPKISKELHLTKEGFIECMSWIDLLRKFKGGRNLETKYTTEYFEDLWDIDLSKEQKAPTVEEFLSGKYHKEEENRKKKRKEAVQNASSSIPTQEGQEFW